MPDLDVEPPPGSDCASILSLEKRYNSKILSQNAKGIGTKWNLPFACMVFDRNEEM